MLTRMSSSLWYNLQRLNPSIIKYTIFNSSQVFVVTQCPAVVHAIYIIMLIMNREREGGGREGGREGGRGGGDLRDRWREGDLEGEVGSNH